jgi:CubicO group peptidase (beta-lactamase class C family)
VRPASLFVACAGAFAFACASGPQGARDARSPASTDPDVSPSFGMASPASQGIDPAKLVALATAVRDAEAPIFSLLISRRGKLVFELYTSRLTRDDAHYVMSVTKSVTSALTGIAIERGLLHAADTPIGDALPGAACGEDRARFFDVTIEDVLGMSALHAPVPPHDPSPAARDRQHAFWAADNRLRFACAQSLLPNPGESFEYTDITPYLVGGAIEYAARETLDDFAREALFGPLGFRNEEWMHEDRAGIDDPAYGLRLRPIDMQKLGVLYLDHGQWNGRQVIPRAWVDKSFEPWIRSHPELHEPDYGRYWWRFRYGPWEVHEANGWKGQRIAVVPEVDLVVTMTGAIEGDEDRVFHDVMERYVVPAVASAPLPESPEADARLREVLRDVNENAMRLRPHLEWRMVPGAAPKEKRRPFTG